MPVVRSDLRAADSLTSTVYLWCWACGRGPDYGHAPSWWHAPWHLHQHHIVRQPRREDRRAVMLLCPICHGRIHGARFPHEPWQTLTLANQLWLKRAHDREFYDRQFLAQSHVTRLPPGRAPAACYARSYDERRGPWPGFLPRGKRPG